MNILARTPIIRRLINKNIRSRIRLINKGHKNLKEQNRLELPMQLRDCLAKTRLNSVILPKSFLCGCGFDIELSTRQFLMSTILGLRFNKSILYSVGSKNPLRHPLPKEWRGALTDQNIDVDHFSSTLLWYAYSIIYWGKGFLYGLKSILPLLKKQDDLGNYVYFSDINDQCMSNNPIKYNIINWYLQWKNKAIGVDSICHSVDNQPNFKLGSINVVRTFQVPIPKKSKLLMYIYITIHTSIYSFLLCFFRPYCGFLLAEIIKLKRVSLVNNSALARDYLFHNSDPFYRPMWTYMAEKKGSRILFYFYSTNDEEFKREGGYPLQKPWYLMSWPYYLVWDKYQENFIKRFDKHNSIIEKVTSVWFSSSEKSIEAPSNSIAVFDVTTMRPTRYFFLGTAYDYYVADIANQFLNDIQLVLNQNNINMLHKMKRVPLFAHKKYLRKINQLRKKSNYIEVEPSIDPFQVIQKTKACISIPFTSTAIIAKIEGRPSVFYDPSGMVQKDDRAAHGIPVLSGIDELKEWVESINNE